MHDQHKTLLRGKENLIAIVYLLFNSWRVTFLPSIIRQQSESFEAISLTVVSISSISWKDNLKVLICYSRLKR